jgi:hypothetical protein
MRQNRASNLARFAVQESHGCESVDEAEAAQMIEGEQISLVDAVRAGDEFILAMGDCARFMEESESPVHVCPNLIYFADFGAKVRRRDIESAVS